jgi:hypothetical protein
MHPEVRDSEEGPAIEGAKVDVTPDQVDALHAKLLTWAGEVEAVGR